MYVASTKIPDLLSAIEALEPQTGETIMLLFAEQKHPDIPTLIDALNARSISVFGGLFPGLVYGNSRMNEGCILKKFKFTMPPFIVRDISTAEFSGMIGAGGIAPAPQKRTALMLIDGLTSGIYQFLEALNDIFGMDANFLGAGAGSMSLKQQPCVFNNEGFFQDAAVVCIIEKTAQLGVRHGWNKIAGPMVATKTNGNSIIQLNWKNAFAVYKGVVEADSGRAIGQENFFDISQAYPFGIFREKEDDIVRDPIAVNDDGEIICIGEVPANTVLYILKGDQQTLIEAAHGAIADCKNGKDTLIDAEDTLVVDCISRTLFLDTHFSVELDAIRQQLSILREEQEPQGVLSLGEISSYGAGLLELFNKTIVVGTFTTAEEP